jgi:uncharacterized protein YdeI (YjbR/CyaY-like superfamily)
VGAVGELPIISFPSRDAWEAWLSEQDMSSTGLWLKIAKKQSGIDSVSYAESLDIALCYGWIDGQKDKFDDVYWLQRFTPRKARSRWSRINRDKAEQLIAEGRMRPGGLQEVERARADGRWDAAYEGQRTIGIPDDLKQELDKHEAARAFFLSLSSSNRYAILYRLHDAKRPETRAHRLQQFVEMLKAGKKIHP